MRRKKWEEAGSQTDRQPEREKDNSLGAIGNYQAAASLYDDGNFQREKEADGIKEKKEHHVCMYALEYRMCACALKETLHHIKTCIKQNWKTRQSTLMLF